VYRRALHEPALAELTRHRYQADAMLVSSLTLATGLLAQDARWRDWRGRWLFSSARLLDWANDQQLQGETTGGAALEIVARYLQHHLQQG